MRVRIARVLAWTWAIALLTIGGCGNPTDNDSAAVQQAQASFLALPTAARERPKLVWNEVPDLPLRVLEWAELNYRELFPPGGTTQGSGSRVSRTYSTGNTILIDNGTIWLQGPVVGSLVNPVKYAELVDFCNSVPVACPSVETRTVMAGGLLREYIVYQPWITFGQAHRKLVLMLHGTGEKARDFMADSGWSPLANREGMVVVYAQALRHCFLEDLDRNGLFEAPAEVQTPVKWAAADLGNPTLFPMCTQAQRDAAVPESQRSSVLITPADDLAYFDAMVADLKTRDGVDPKGIYATGFSHGGAMVGRLAAERSSVLAAAASTSGVITPGFPTAPRGVPFVFAFGEIDPGYTGKLTQGRPFPLTDIGLQASSLQLQPVLDGLVRPFTVPFRLDESRYVFNNLVINGKTIALYSFSESTARPAQSNAFHLAVVQGMRHEYPNGEGSGIGDILSGNGVSNHPLEMAVVQWSFFRANPMP